MIEIGLLFKNIIPMEMLARMPLPFVHRLRDIRKKQLELSRADMEGSSRTPPQPSGPPIMDDPMMDDLIDELS